MKMNILKNVDLNLQPLTTIQEELYKCFEKAIEEKSKDEQK